MKNDPARAALAPTNRPVRIPTPHKDVWLVEDRGDKSVWTKVGVALPNTDGSYTIHLAAIPTNSSGRLNLRDPA